MRTSTFSIFLLLLLLSTSFASASTLTISDMRMTHDQMYEVYLVTPNETFYQGELDFSDSGNAQFLLINNASYNYHLVCKPTPIDWFATVPSTLEYVTSSEGSRFLGMLLVFALFGGGFAAIFIKSVR